MARLRAAGCVFAEDEADVLLASASSPGELEALVRRRVAGEPLEHVVGWVDFAGLRVAVAPGVFVPRQRSRLLVREAVPLLVARRGCVVVDLCCGSGAVGLAAVAALAAAGAGPVVLHAADVDPAAVACARANLAALAPPDAAVHEGDLYDALPAALRGRVDVLVANAPYVPTGRIALMPPEARLHESAVSLDGGADGLDVHRRVAAGAPAWLAPGGHLVLETSVAQAPTTAALCAAAGLAPRVVRDDDADATVVVAARTGSP